MFFFFAQENQDACGSEDDSEKSTPENVSKTFESLPNDDGLSTSIRTLDEFKKQIHTFLDAIRTSSDERVTTDDLAFLFFSALFTIILLMFLQGVLFSCLIYFCQRIYVFIHIFSAIL